MRRWLTLNGPIAFFNFPHHILFNVKKRRRNFLNCDYLLHDKSEDDLTES